jgi:indole-3-glycerol phosphate synthase
MSDILQQIVDRKRERLDEAKRIRPLGELRAVAPPRGDTGRFADALRINRINIIAEVKRRSPSKGVIRENFDAVAIARNYAGNGAAAISVLTEEDYFDGSLNYLRRIAAETDLPLLRKDFIFDEYQLYEALEAGASAVLLIAAMLDPSLFNDLLQSAHALGLDALVEVHDMQEAEKVLRCDVRLLGVNNRNLRTFATTLETSIELAVRLPRELTLVSESGIRTRRDIDRLRAAGFSAFLIGEELMRAPDEGEALRLLLECNATEHTEFTESTEKIRFFP